MQRDRNAFRLEVSTWGDGDRVAIFGVIDEHADLSPLAALGARAVEVDLKGVRRINSFGVRLWIDAVRAIPITTALRFINCPSPVVDQCNMVGGFLGHGTLVSFFAPMVCEECDEQVDQLFQTEECRRNEGKLPDTSCPRCGRPMEVDDLEDQYLLFIRESSAGETG